MKEGSYTFQAEPIPHSCQLSTPWLEVPCLKFMCLVGNGKKCPGDQLLWGTNAATDLVVFSKFLGNYSEGFTDRGI